MFIKHIRIRFYKRLKLIVMLVHGLGLSTGGGGATIYIYIGNRNTLRVHVLKQYILWP